MSIKRPEGGWKISRSPVHPGEMLVEEFLKPSRISIDRLAHELHVPVTRISEIADRRRGITADTALRFAQYFGTSAQFWMNLRRNTIPLLKLDFPSLIAQANCLCRSCR